MSLPTRKLGDAQVTAIGWGAMGISSSAYGPTPPDEERLKFLDDLYATGCTFWDTADVYGESEDLLAKWCDCLHTVGDLVDSNHLAGSGDQGRETTYSSPQRGASYFSRIVR